jgi:hypothetical protein
MPNRSQNSGGSGSTFNFHGRNKNTEEMKNPDPDNQNENKAMENEIGAREKGNKNKIWENDLEKKKTRTAPIGNSGAEGDLLLVAPPPLSCLHCEENVLDLGEKQIWDF